MAIPIVPFILDAKAWVNSLACRDRVDSPSERTEFSRVVVAVLRAGSGVQVEVNTDAVFTRPFDGFEEVSGEGQIWFREVWMYSLPCNAWEERFARSDFNGPVGNGNTDPVQASTGDLCKVFFGL